MLYIIEKEKKIEMSTFHSKTPDERREEVLRLLKKYPNKIPLILNKASNKETVTHLTNDKFLVPMDITVGQFLYMVRKRIVLPAEKALFIFFGNKGELPSTSESMLSVYEQYRSNEDDMLYAVYSSESTFG
jgi:GABA(A) receptor-associated protein